MKYQIAFYDRAPECWRFHRDGNDKITTFDSLDAAEQRAIELCRGRGVGAIVLTLHGAFRVETEYPKVEPITHLKRLDLDNLMAPPAEESIT